VAGFCWEGTSASSGVWQFRSRLAVCLGFDWSISLRTAKHQNQVSFFQNHVSRYIMAYATKQQMCSATHGLEKTTLGFDVWHFSEVGQKSPLNSC
jgi:hypothetical protein